jgi:transcriptional regulator with XRE-family HTH domain
VAVNEVPGSSEVPAIRGLIERELMATRESWRNVGRRIRYLRKLNRLTIRQLAAGCGLSPNAISLVERGEVAPTVVTLCRIASALGVPPGSFLQEICPNEVILTRARDSQGANQALDALACALKPQGQGSAPRSQAVPGDREDSAVSYSPVFALCVSGQVEYEADGERHQLEPGDRLSFNGSVPHRWRNKSAAPAVTIVVFQAGPGQEDTD